MAEGSSDAFTYPAVVLKVVPGRIGSGPRAHRVTLGVLTGTVRPLPIELRLPSMVDKLPAAAPEVGDRWRVTVEPEVAGRG